MTQRFKIWIIVSVVLVALAAAAAIAYPFAKRAFFAPRESNVETGRTLNTINGTTPPTVAPVAPDATVAPEDPTLDGPAVETVATNLDIPWELAFLPDSSGGWSGDMLVTQRPGQLVRIGQDRSVIPVEGVRHVGEGGLLGLALHPDFESNGLLYLYMTTAEAGGLTNRVERYRLEDTTLSERSTLTERTVILDEIPGAANHDGGRLAFGPDKKLYVTTGDSQAQQLAQDTSSLAGKVLRLNDDGSVPADNPFGNAVWSYGHRNVQGITWDDAGRLWVTEHGPSGSCPECGQDEVNLVERGANYGWPTITGDATASGLRAPVLHSGVDDTWAPSGMAFYSDVSGARSLFFAGLRGSALYEARLDDGSAVSSATQLVEHFKSDFGRLRNVVRGPDGYLYILTSNTDGRGAPDESDDKIIRVNPRLF